MRRAGIALLALLPIVRPLRADLMATGQIGLTSLTITPSAGVIRLLPPQNSPNGCSLAAFCAAAFASGQDSLGGLDQHFNVADNGTTSSTAATTLTGATGKASAPNLTASSSGSVAIGVTASASASSQGTLTATFEVFNATGPVNVQFGADFDLSQLLSTDFTSLSASSEVILHLDVNGSPVLFYDNPLSVGPNQFQSFSDSLSRSGSFTVDSGTPVSLFIQTDAEVSGNFHVPEPSGLVQLLTMLTFCGLIAGLGMRFRRSGG